MPILYYGNAVNHWTVSCASAMNDKFYTEFSDKDCCFEITSIEFFMAICLAARENAQIGSVFCIDYLNSSEIIDGYIRHRKQNLEWQSPFLPTVKNRKHEWQREVRLLIEPKIHPDLEKYRSRDLFSEMTNGEINADDPNVNIDQRMLREDALHYNIEPLFISAPEARQFTRLVEVK